MASSKLFTLTDPVFSTACIFFSGTKDEYRAYVKKRKLGFEVGNSVGSYVRIEEIATGKECGLIYMPPIERSARFIAVLSHELLHFILDTAEMIGIEFDKSSEEYYTYLYDYYLERILLKCDLFPKKSKKRSK